MIVFSIVFVCCLTASRLSLGGDEHAHTRAYTCTRTREHTHGDRLKHRSRVWGFGCVRTREHMHTHMHTHACARACARQPSHTHARTRTRSHALSLARALPYRHQSSRRAHTHAWEKTLTARCPAAAEEPGAPSPPSRAATRAATQLQTTPACERKKQRKQRAPRAPGALAYSGRVSGLVCRVLGVGPWVRGVFLPTLPGRVWCLGCRVGGLGVWGSSV